MCWNFERPWPISYLWIFRLIGKVVHNSWMRYGTGHEPGLRESIFIMSSDEDPSNVGPTRHHGIPGVADPWWWSVWNECNLGPIRPRLGTVPSRSRLIHRITSKKEGCEGRYMTLTRRRTPINTDIKEVLRFRRHVKYGYVRSVLFPELIISNWPTCLLPYNERTNLWGHIF